MDKRQIKELLTIKLLITTKDKERIKCSDLSRENSAKARSLAQEINQLHIKLLESIK